MKHTDARRRQLLAAAVLLQLAILSGRSAAEEPQPADVVQKLYREVVARHPMGVPHGAAKTSIWPLLSKRLISALETRNACDNDWARKHPYSEEHPVKPPGFYEDGLFSGGDERGYINGAELGSTKEQSDGSYLVYVKLWSYLDMSDRSLRSSGKIYRWKVAARVTSEDGKFVVDDILLFNYDKSVYMSKMLTSGCRGTHSTSD